MSRIGFSLSLVVLLVGSSSLASEAGFRYSRGIVSRSLSGDELLSARLDAAVFAETQPGLPDMRLLDGQREAVAFLLRRVQTTRARTVKKTWSVRQPTVRPLEGGGLEIILELEQDDPRPNGLTLVSHLKNFEQRVQVYSSVARENWQPVGEEAVVFDYSRFMDVRKDSVEFKVTRNRHFRIVIDDVTAAQESELLELTRRLRGGEETEREERVTIERRPFRIERINFWREAEEDQAAGDMKADYPVRGFRVEQDSEKQQTVIVVETGREPLTSLELQTPERNFSRRAAVEVEQQRGVQTSWRTIGQATLTRIDFKGLKQEQLAIGFPESRQETYRLVIDDRDSPPLEVSGIKADGNVYEVLFLASRDTSYQLVYGSDDAESPQYDTAAIARVLGEGFQPTQAELGPVGTGTGRPAVFRWSDLVNNRPLLFGAIALLVIVLAWGLYHAAKGFEELPSE